METPSNELRDLGESSKVELFKAIYSCAVVWKFQEDKQGPMPLFSIIRYV